jgi:hypothetical protein
MLGIELSLSSRGRMTLGVGTIFWFISHTMPYQSKGLGLHIYSWPRQASIYQDGSLRCYPSNHHVKDYKDQPYKTYSISCTGMGCCRSRAVALPAAKRVGGWWPCSQTKRDGHGWAGRVGWVAAAMVGVGGRGRREVGWSCLLQGLCHQND